MSQKTNIESLNSILETVNSLPDAGSGGSDIKTCILTMQTTLMNQVSSSSFFSCVTPNGVVTELANGASVEVICPSIVTVRKAGVESTTVSGNIELLYQCNVSVSGNQLINVYRITGDCSMHVWGDGS